MPPDPEPDTRLPIPAEAGPPPAAVRRALRRDSRLVLQVLRLVVTGSQGWGMARHQLRMRFPLDVADRAISAFDRLTAVLDRGARRRFVPHAPGPRGVSADELAVLTLIAAVQAKEFCHAGALARWLVAPAYQVRLVSAAACVGGAFEAGGVVLVPPRVSAAWPGLDG